MPEKWMTFGREFREGAVRIVQEAGKPIPAIAPDLGVNEGTLGNWINRACAEPEGRGELCGGDVRLGRLVGWPRYEGGPLG